MNRFHTALVFSLLTLNKQIPAGLIDLILQCLIECHKSCIKSYSHWLVFKNLQQLFLFNLYYYKKKTKFSVIINKKWSHNNMEISLYMLKNPQNQCWDYTYCYLRIESGKWRFFVDFWWYDAVISYYFPWLYWKNGIIDSYLIQNLIRSLNIFSLWSIYGSCSLSSNFFQFFRNRTL